MYLPRTRSATPFAANCAVSVTGGAPKTRGLSAHMYLVAPEGIHFSWNANEGFVITSISRQFLPPEFPEEM